jgi:hypothetical protein
MDVYVELLKRIYDRFNARDVDGVLAVLADVVAWANGMDGGHVHGREAVRGTGRASGPWSVRTCELSSNCGWRDHRRSPAVRPRSRRQTGPGADARVLAPNAPFCAEHGPLRLDVSADDGGVLGHRGGIHQGVEQLEPDAPADQRLNRLYTVVDGP